MYVMSLVQLFRVTNYWSPILGTPLIQETMVVPGPGFLSLADFCLEVAVSLCKMGTTSNMTSRHSLENELQAKKCACWPEARSPERPAQHAPTMEYDKIGHWPIYMV